MQFSNEFIKFKYLEKLMKNKKETKNNKRTQRNKKEEILASICSTRC